MLNNYKSFIKESGQTVNLTTGNYGFVTNKYGRNSIAELNRKIYEYINKTYAPFGYDPGRKYDYNIDINGLIVNTEYISKMVNNYTIFKKFIYLNKISDSYAFYIELERNFNDVYHYNGKFFIENSLPILINTTRKGNIGEAKSKEVFANYARKKGINIRIENPTMSEDVNGVDGKFSINGKYFTIQVKPFTRIIKEDEFVRVESVGALTLGVNYLVLYNDNKFIISKNEKKNPITIDGSDFIIPNPSFVYISN